MSVKMYKYINIYIIKLYEADYNMIEEKHMDESRLENRNRRGIVNKSHGTETTNTGLLTGRPVKIRNKKHKHK